MYVREVQKTLVLAGVETEGSAHHQRLVSLVESHRAVMVIFMQVRCVAISRSLARAAVYLHDSFPPASLLEPSLLCVCEWFEPSSLCVCE